MTRRLPRTVLTIVFGELNSAHDAFQPEELQFVAYFFLSFSSSS
jgi:hypothetical protein